MTPKAKRGQIIIAAVFALVIISLLGVLAVALLSSESASVYKKYFGIQALNVAEGGIRFTVASSLAANSDLTTLVDFGPVPLGPGTFSVHFIYKAKNACSFEVTGTVQGDSRTVRVGYRQGFSLSQIAQNYALYCGNGSGTFDFGNNVSISGNIFANGSLNLNGAAVSGDAISTGSISGSSGVTGAVEQQTATPEGVPVLDLTPYLTQITTAQVSPTYTGNRTFSGTLAGGAYYVRGNVTINDLTLTGVTTIVATGKVTIYNNKTIGDNLTVIASGEINMDNHNNLGANGLWYSSVGIVVGNNSDVGENIVGAGTCFITPGYVNVDNSLTFNGFIYANTLSIDNNLNMNGLIVANNVDIHNNTDINISADIVNFDVIPGLSVQASGAEACEFLEWSEVY